MMIKKLKGLYRYFFGKIDFEFSSVNSEDAILVTYNDSTIECYLVTKIVDDIELIDIDRTALDIKWLIYYNLGVYVPTDHVIIYLTKVIEGKSCN